MKSFTRDELNRLLEVARAHSVADYWMILVTWNHGLRVSEMLALTAENFRGGLLNVARLKGSRKTLQPILAAESPETRSLFMAFVAASSGRLFPTYRMDFWRKLQRYGREAGIHDSKCHPHSLKHSCGRLAYEGGMGIPEIQTWLGHVEGGNTMRYMEATEEQAANAFAAAAGGKS